MKDYIIIHGGKMKKLVVSFLLIVLGLFLVSCSLVETNINVDTLNHISTKIMDSNVKVNVYTFKKTVFGKVEGPHRGIGSGVIIKKEKNTYYLLTNAHVVNLNNEYDHEYKVTNIYNSEIQADLVFLDFDYDLAILKFVSDNNLSVISLANKNARIGEIVFSVGSPSGRQNIVTAGKIIGYNKIKNVSYEVLIHEAYIHKGSSGSMLINERYELVGINTWGFHADNEVELESYIRGGATPIEKVTEFLSLHNFNI